MKYVLAFMKSFIFSFLLTYFAIDVWRLATGDLLPLRKKGILVEWLVHSKKEYNDTLAEFTDSHTYTGFRITYTYHEPLLLRQSEQ